MSYIVTLKRCELSIFDDMFNLDNYSANFRVAICYLRNNYPMSCHDLYLF